MRLLSLLQDPVTAATAGLRPRHRHRPRTGPGAPDTARALLPYPGLPFPGSAAGPRTCTGVIWWKRSSRSARSTPGLSGTGSEFQLPSVTASILAGRCHRPAAPPPRGRRGGALRKHTPRQLPFRCTSVPPPPAGLRLREAKQQTLDLAKNSWFYGELPIAVSTSAGHTAALCHPTTQNLRYRFRTT